MDIIILVGMASLLIYGFYQGRKKAIEFNDECSEQFGFSPIEVPRIAIAASPPIILVVGLDSSVSNAIGGIFCTAAIFFGLYRYIRSKTDNATAKKATAILAAYGFVSLVLVLLYIALLAAASNDDDDRSRFW